VDHRDRKVAPARRTPYGTHSPTVGERGSKTRAAVLEAAHRVFRVKGFGAATIDDIAQEMSVARATVYQYFPSKREIYYELLDDNAREILDLAYHLGDLSPTRNGFLHLRWWILQFSKLYESNRLVFQIWSSAVTNDQAVGELARKFVHRYAELLTDRLPGGVCDDGPLAMPATLFGLLDGVNTQRLVYHRALNLNGDQLSANLAVLVQSVLFPDSTADPGEDYPSEDLWAAFPFDHLNTSPDPPAPMPLSDSARQLRDAARDVFSATGYAESSVEQIVERAGVSRTAFYRTFPNKRAVLLELIISCVSELTLLFTSFRNLHAESSEADIHEWFGSYVDTFWRHADVLVVWNELLGDDPELASIAQGLFLTELKEMTKYFEAAPLPPGVAPITASFALVALLERIPLYAYLLRDVLDREAVVRQVSRFIHHGFFEKPT
jgi:AcrR family transcriptional regulator